MEERRINIIIDISKTNYILFNNIAIEISSKCNRKCFFCPNAYYDRPDKYMPLKTINKIFDELSELRYNKRIEFYLYNEPTRDKRLLEIIKLARKKLPKSCLMINTNGDYFKSYIDIYNLFVSGLNQLEINIYNSKKYDKILVLVNEVKKYYPKLEINGNSSLYQYIYPNKKIVKIIDKSNINTSNRKTDKILYITNRAGNIENFIPSLKSPLNKYCTRPFRFLNINYEGNVILCCNDYKGEIVFGNVENEKLVDIWNNKNFNIYRLYLQNKNRNLPLCNKCDFSGGFYPHMIKKVTFGEQEDLDILSGRKNNENRNIDVSN